MTAHAFHLAIAIHDLDAARAFYGDLLGCSEGRSAERWIDFDFFSHQLSVHLAPAEHRVTHNPVDGDEVPVPHFGAVLAWDTWHALESRLRAHGVDFIIPPKLRFRGEVGEQATMFFADPSGNTLELKSFRDPSQLFAR